MTDIEPHTKKKNPTYLPTVKKKKSHATYPLLKHLSKQLKQNIF